jgi:hypothetical protein
MFRQFSESVSQFPDFPVCFPHAPVRFRTHDFYLLGCFLHFPVRFRAHDFHLPGIFLQHSPDILKGGSPPLCLSYISHTALLVLRYPKPPPAAMRGPEYLSRSLLYMGAVLRGALLFWEKT